MEFVVFSGYVSLREVVFVLRFINKTHKHISCNYFKWYTSLFRVGKALTFPNYKVMTCTNCESTKRRCRRDPFLSVMGSMCYNCQPRLMSLTETRQYLDRCAIKTLDKVYRYNCTYFLYDDVLACDFIFDGPNDRRIEREKRNVISTSKRCISVNTVFTKNNIEDPDELEQLQHSTYIKSFINYGKHGIRAITKLINECYVASKITQNQLIQFYNSMNIDTVNFKHTHPLCNGVLTQVPTLGRIIDWAVTLDYQKPFFNIDIARIEIEANSLRTYIERYYRSKKEREQRQQLLRLAVEHYELDTKFAQSTVDRYIHHNIPTIDKVCKTLHEMMWLYNKTPFCEYIVLLKQRKGIRMHGTVPIPYSHTIYHESAEAKARVLSLGYTCPTFDYDEAAFVTHDV